MESAQFLNSNAAKPGGLGQGAEQPGAMQAQVNQQMYVQQ